MEEIRLAQSVEEIAAARNLFTEYAESLGFSLCFQGFDQELATLPGRYAPPRGRLLLAWVDGAPAGCVALRPLNQDTAEMKRLYVRPEYQGRGLGRRLAIRVVEEATTLGYRGMWLDTIPATMGPAVALYRSLGFENIPAYTDHQAPGSVCMGRVL